MGLLFVSRPGNASEGVKSFSLSSHGKQQEMSALQEQEEQIADNCQQEEIENIS